MKFLVTDDAPEITRIIKDALNNSNYSVDIASDDGEVLSMAAINDYDCIIKYYQNSDVIRLGDLTLNCNSFEISCGKESARLTNKEFKLLLLFMQNPQILFSTEALMKRFWDWNGDAEINVVWTNIGYLRRKLESIGAHVTIRSSRGRGYKIVETR